MTNLMTTQITETINPIEVANMILSKYRLKRKITCK